MLAPDESYQEDGKDVGDTGKEDLVAARSLEEIFAGLRGCQYITLSLKEWEERRDEFLDDDRGKDTVFLFDRNFSNEGGSQDGGIELVREVQNKTIGGCGLLSHTIGTDSERDAWREIVDEFDLRRDRFVVIAKERLTRDSSGYRHFLELLRLVGLSGRYAKLKSVAWSFFEESVAAAGEFVDGMSVFDFDRAVFQSVENGGRVGS